ncbi:hypothetical protein IWX49DRAFT_405457 [Phyllosticta citricarpa]|uniref:Uncharacterized protein n=2 Tax=Phyllosticta TaxID=121621 RepID=A0ABR1L1Q3_9PEZI
MATGFRMTNQFPWCQSPAICFRYKTATLLNRRPLEQSHPATLPPINKTKPPTPAQRPEHLLLFAKARYGPDLIQDQTRRATRSQIRPTNAHQKKKRSVDRSTQFSFRQERKVPRVGANSDGHDAQSMRRAASHGTVPIRQSETGWSRMASGAGMHACLCVCVRSLCVASSQSPATKLEKCASEGKSRHSYVASLQANLQRPPRRRLKAVRPLRIILLLIQQQHPPFPLQPCQTRPTLACGYM